MMTLQEAEALPIPEQFKKTPNIYRLARIIRSTGDADRIMASLEVLAASGALDALKPAQQPSKEENK